jgi:SAM-dependent methyltransferase
MATATSSIDAQRAALLQIAEAVAPGWERRRAEVEEAATPVREWMLHVLRPREGSTILELAAGIGDTGFEAAPILGESGRLITTDLSPAMLAAARRRGAELGVDNVDYQVIDAECNQLADDSVDGVLCRFGYMLMPDPVTAFAETRRVLRPGGRLALAVWGAMERNPWTRSSASASDSAATSRRPSRRPHRGRSAWRTPNASSACCATPASPRYARRTSRGSSSSPTRTSIWA